MRRIALILAAVAVAAFTVSAAAGADDKRSYQAELFNAFGLVNGSELRIAGVKAGTITDMDITENKTALISFDVGPGFPDLKADASCSSEPQSLIAEYFLDCQPGTSDQPLEGPIPAAKNQTTVQNDLVQNVMREPYKRRFQLIINEFGTALVGNSENLNAAIRAGAPALRELSEVLKILGRQNRIIAGLNTDADAIFARLTERKEDVVRFIDNAGRTAAISAERRDDLAKNFDLLDDFLFELQPVMVQLGNLAREQTPLLTDLYAAAPGLNKLGTNLPRFNDGTRVSLESLSPAAKLGKVAFANAQDEITSLNRASTKAFPAADIVAKFLQSIDDPANATEEDAKARTDLSEQPGEADRRVALLNQKIPGGGLANPGYTGMEGLLNYAYIQTLSLNLFDQLGHALHFTLVSAPDVDPCTAYQTGPEVPAVGGGTTSDPKQFAPCAGILGDKQPGINYGTNPSGLFGQLGRYDPSVCPDGSARLSICNPADPPHLAGAFQQQAAAPKAAAPTPSPEETEKLLDKLKQPGVKPPPPKKLREILGLPPGMPLPIGITEGLGVSGADQQAAATNLLDFLFGP